MTPRTVRAGAAILGLAAALGLTLGCGEGAPDTPAPARPSAGDKRPERGEAGEHAKGRKAPSAPPTPVAAKGNGAPRTVIFAVLDTVRADHTSLCGYARPTTPTLQNLADKGAVHTCRAYSPAPWTHPSHASFFTGKPVNEHAAIWVTASEVAINPVTRVRPLNDAFDTVAEDFAARGYQTVAVSANMIITEPSGLLQGFETKVVTPSSLGLRGPKLRKKFREVVDDLDPERPLFLFVNMYDAHDPYPEVPEKVPWLPTQPRTDLLPNQHDDASPYYRYVKGLASQDEVAPFLRSVVNGYDWGIHEADANLGAVLGMLAQHGWLGDDFRIVVTADHGEMLGEHQLLRHGGYLYEGMVNVPLLYFDATADAQPTFPEPVSGLVVHDLLLTGTLPDLPVTTITEKNDNDVLVGVIGAATWDGTDKGWCVDHDTALFHLATDPGEEHPGPLPPQSGLGQSLATTCEAVDRMIALPAPKADDPDLVEALKAVGYME
ncbi:MAG: sulfatase-like hydrolase/transferase [Alphaproteobacteria bacterium]|nr:sulfatase-like hydrolase/transferase [Alphaproteobacteria bacterium]